MKRRDLVAEVERGGCPCWQDPLTGTDYEHRRELIRQRLEFLAGIMGIEVLGYSVMSNHFHCILRNRHNVVETWSDEDVARKWWLLCPARKTKDGLPAEPGRSGQRRSHQGIDIPAIGARGGRSVISASGRNESTVADFARIQSCCANN